MGIFCDSIRFYGIFLDFFGIFPEKNLRVIHHLNIKKFPFFLNYVFSINSFLDYFCLKYIIRYTQYFICILGRKNIRNRKQILSIAYSLTSLSWTYIGSHALFNYFKQRVSSTVQELCPKSNSIVSSS